ncbi:MAG: amino acid ABC transporter permease [Deltaproteobacteria bacterium]|nr:amino acid ABC transporter permease [Deltaproteobacteria bacterium]
MGFRPLPDPPPFQQETRITPLDAVLAGTFILVAAYLGYRIKTGLNYHWNWGAIPQYLFRYDPDQMGWVPNILLQGLTTTIKLSIWSTLLATIIGIVMGLFRVSKSLFRRLLGRVYVESVRNLPPLVLIFIFYYFISSQILPILGLDAVFEPGHRWHHKLWAGLLAPPDLLPAFLAALITLSVFEGSYITEIIRAGIESIDSSQWEGSKALGMNRRQQLWCIILPQAGPRILAPLANQFISTIKDSAIVSVISIQELTFQGLELMAATHLTFEIWITVACLYLSITLSCSMVVSRLEAVSQKP